MSDTRCLSADLFEQLRQQATEQPRRRTNHNLHQNYQDPVQRFLNVIWSDSYVRPHRHNRDPLWEGFVIVQGTLGVYRFDDAGTLIERVDLSVDGPDYAIELDATGYHCLSALSESVIVFEYKPGPYEESNDKTFANWSPEEGSEQGLQFNQWLKTARCGERF